MDETIQLAPLNAVKVAWGLMDLTKTLYGKDTFNPGIQRFVRPGQPGFRFLLTFRRKIDRPGEQDGLSQRFREALDGLVTDNLFEAAGGLFPDGPKESKVRAEESGALYVTADGGRTTFRCSADEGSGEASVSVEVACGSPEERDSVLRLALVACAEPSHWGWP